MSSRLGGRPRFKALHGAGVAYRPPMVYQCPDADEGQAVPLQGQIVVTRTVCSCSR